MKRLREDPRSYKIERCIGEGGFAQVFLASDEKGKRYALKRIAKRNGIENVVTRETLAGRKLSHPNVIKLIANNENIDFYDLTFEHVKGGRSLYS